MKRFLLAGVIVSALTGCSSSTIEKPTSTQLTQEPAHTAVTAYLQHRLVKYAPVRWFPSDTWTRHDSLDMIVAPIKHGGVLTKEELAYVRKAEASADFHDSTRLGTWTSHTYRFQNSQGNYVLDSTQFVVYNNGKVQPLYESPRSPLK
jgi:hypothetical protein